MQLSACTVKAIKNKTTAKSTDFFTVISSKCVQTRINRDQTYRIILYNFCQAFDKNVKGGYHKDMKVNKKETSTEHSFTVMYEPVKGGGYQVTVPVLPGVISYGRDIEEAKKMARDAIRCHVEGLQKEHEPIPSERSLLQERLTISFA